MLDSIRVDAKVILYLISVEIIALFIANNLMSQEVELVDGGAGVGTSLMFFLLILVATTLLLVIIRLKLSKYLYLFTEYFGLFFIALFIVSSLSESPLMGMLAGILSVIFKLILGKNRMVGLVISSVISIGIASLIGITFGPVPLIILLLLLSIYDFVAVKKTKHMIRMAEDVIKEKGPQLLSFSSGNDEIIIGLADIIFPSALFVSVYLNDGIYIAILTSLASIVGLIVLFKGPVDEGMPAIPFVSLGIVGYIIGILVF